MELWQHDATELAHLIRKGEVSALEVTRNQLARLEAVNPSINAISRVLADEALVQARSADEARTRGDALGLLHGVPVTTKVTADHKGCASDAGIGFRKDDIASEDGAVVGNLRAAGAIFIGRTTSPASAMRAMTSSALHGLTLNPWNPDVTCGGSSGGAGAATAAGIGALALGSDIGGSIRWPAHCNGIVGLRPTVGRVPSVNPSRPGPRMHSGQTMAVEGPMARSVRDVRLGLEVMSRGDHRDGVWVPAPLVGLPAPPRAAIMPAPFGYEVDPACAEAVRRAGRHLAAAGYEVEEIEVPEFRAAAELWETIGLPQLNLTLVPALGRIADPALTHFFETWVEAKGVADLKAFVMGLAERDRLLTVWSIFMEQFPVIVLPNSPTPFLETELDIRGREGALATLDGIRFQFPCPVLGLPGISVPVGSFKGQPLGVQMISRRFREDLLLSAGEVIEAAEGIFTPIDPVVG
jgi:amidase